MAPEQTMHHVQTAESMGGASMDEAGVTTANRMRHEEIPTALARPFVVEFDRRNSLAELRELIIDKIRLGDDELDDDGGPRRNSAYLGSGIDWTVNLGVPSDPDDLHIYAIEPHGPGFYL